MSGQRLAQRGPACGPCRGVRGAPCSTCRLPSLAAGNDQCPRHAHTSPSLVQLGRLASWHPSPVSIHPLSHGGSVSSLRQQPSLSWGPGSATGAQRRYVRSRGSRRAGCECQRAQLRSLPMLAGGVSEQGRRLLGSCTFLPPFPAGIGVGMLLVSSLVSLYYNVIIAWTFYYLGMSFQSPLPWSCDAPRNAPLCQVCLLPPGRPLRCGGPGYPPQQGSLAWCCLKHSAAPHAAVDGLGGGICPGQPGPLYVRLLGPGYGYCRRWGRPAIV